MERLLEWGINHSDPAEQKNVERNKLDPEIIEFILGKDDATQMKECVSIACDPGRPLSERLASFDHLEMLVESIDNAANVEKLSLWPQILLSLADPDAEIRKFALWIMGTCAQNNPPAQTALLRHGALTKCLKIIASGGEETIVKNKALYCLSGVIQHCDAAYAAFIAINALKTLDKVLQEQDSSFQDRLMFFMRAMVKERAEFGEHIKGSKNIYAAYKAYEVSAPEEQE